MEMSQKVVPTECEPVPTNRRLPSWVGERYRLWVDGDGIETSLCECGAAGHLVEIIADIGNAIVERMHVPSTYYDIDGDG
jgi:hypothetical protein